MFSVGHTKLKRVVGRPKGSSKYLAALRAAAQALKVREIQRLVGNMTGHEPSYMATYLSVNALAGNGQVIRCLDQKYIASEHHAQHIAGRLPTNR